MKKNNADYWNSQAVREYGGIAFAVAFFIIALGMWLL